MAKAQFRSVDEYIAAQPEAVREKLEQVRSAIRKGAPRAEETILYGMPTYKLDGERLLCFAVWKEHFALYAATKGVAAAFGKELARFEIEKGTIRFPIGEAAPVGLIAQIAKFRVKEVG